MRHYLFLLFIILLTSCENQKKVSQKSEVSNDFNQYQTNLNNQVTIRYYSQEQEEIYQSKGILLNSKKILTTIPPSRKNIALARVSYEGEKSIYYINGYNGVDLENGIYVLDLNYPKTQTQAPIISSDSLQLKNLYSLGFKNNKEILVYQDTINSNYQFFKTLLDGTPVYTKSHTLAGISVTKDNHSYLIPIENCKTLIDSSILQKFNSISDLKNIGIYFPPLNKVIGFKFSTNYGNFTIKVYDDLPEYKKNFIKLVATGYYDSLLVHRIIPNFIIQTGSPDSRYAVAKEEIGRSGPGYRLQNKPLRKYFHKRGAVAASKLPIFENIRNECDGGQFYIVAGRKFSSRELDDLEEDKHRFTLSERTYYETIGGAPHLDGDYTVFGEIISGMDVVDKISREPIDSNERPKKDIRITKVKILLK